MAAFTDWDARASTPAYLGDWKTEGQWKFFPHIELIEENFLDVIVGDCRRLIITIPPQHGKSLYISGHGLQWAMGKFPHWRCALVSHGASLAKKWGRQARDFFREHGMDLFGVQLDPSRRAADNWGFLGKGGGGLITTGVGGPLVGEPVDLGIIDDFFKNAEKAMSPSAREKLKDWYSTVFLTRLSKQARVIIICTRWHEDDLVGWLQDMAAESGDVQPWKVVNLMAVAPHPDEIPEDEHHIVFPDPLGRKPGEALCPELHPIEQLNEARAIQGEDWFWAVQQGRPTPPGGGMFSDQMLQTWVPAELPVVQNRGVWEYFSTQNRFDEVVMSLDARWSLKTTLTGSYVVAQVWGRLGAKKLLLDQARGRWGLEDSILQVEELCRQWPMIGAKLFEAKALGPEIKRRLDSKIPGIVLWPCEGGDKVQRAHAQMHHFRGLNVYVPEIAWRAWVLPFRKELLRFPKGTGNDQVDAATQAMSYFGSSAGIAAPLTAARESAEGLEILRSMRGGI